MKFFEAADAIGSCLVQQYCWPYAAIILMLTVVPFVLGIAMIAVGIVQDYRRNRRFW